MTLLGHGLATALYLLGALLGWRPLRGVEGGRALRLCLGAGALLHTLGLYGLHRQQPPVPLESVPAALSLIGWLVSVSFLGALRIARVQSAGAWVAPVAAAFTLSAEVGLQLGIAPAQAPEGSSLWSHAHVLLSTAGFSLLALASLAGLGYLAQERMLKRKVHRGPALGPELPALESLDRVEHIALALGFLLLTLGVVTGFVWAIARGEDPWSTHALFLLLAWVGYLFPVGLRLVRHQHGPRPALGVVFGFALLAFSYLGIRLLGSVA
jgi:ABC-type transport system involved in cytochrome c biogenesis permease subunit